MAGRAISAAKRQTFMSRLLSIIAALLLATTGARSSVTETVVWNFDTQNYDAGNPFANNLLFDGSNFYGVTWEGGETVGCLNGCGTVFELSPNSSGVWTETLLYRFNPSNGSDGSNPIGGLVRDNQGNLYGATYFGGGTTSCNNGCGTVFELSPGLAGWTETILYRFTGNSDGNYPYSTLTLAKDGTLYGTTYGGNATSSLGTVYRLSPTSAGSWTLTTLHAFTDSPDGSYPEGPVEIDSLGRLYGTTSHGGAYGYGSVYQLTCRSNNCRISILHDFNSADGAFPSWVALIADSAGDLYGTTENGGVNNTGTVWKLTYSPTTKTFSEQVLYSFGPQQSTDGNYPWTGVTMGADGRLYGTTSQGGPNNYGTIFALGLNKYGKWKERVLYSFTGLHDGAQPGGSLLYLYNRLFGIADGGGTDSTGVVFELATAP
jgi:uncharacterized repeat protein (TIGR03803 family)